MVTNDFLLYQKRLARGQTISELRKQFASLESPLKERDENLCKGNAQIRSLNATYLPKQSEKQSTAAEPKSDEQKAAEESDAQSRELLLQ